jgi:hypothetical protein
MVGWKRSLSVFFDRPKTFFGSDGDLTLQAFVLVTAELSEWPQWALKGRKCAPSTPEAWNPEPERKGWVMLSVL